MLYYLSLGSNLGEREQTLLRATEYIEERIGPIRMRSSMYYSAPWGFESENGFCNICLSLETPLSPHEVLRLTQEIEHDLGRTTKSHDGIYHDRPIDIDLLLCYDDKQEISINTEELTLPHPLMQERDFVMVPLREIL